MERSRLYGRDALKRAPNSRFEYLEYLKMTNVSLSSQIERKTRRDASMSCPSLVIVS